ncbi:MAG: DUF177 domain-containing protein [Pseudomonadota bacterium]
MTAPPEFSRLIAVERIIPNKSRAEKIEATGAECAALAVRLDLRALGGLKGRISLLRMSDGNVIRIEGDIEADVVQSCVVSLQDVPSRVNLHFDTCFTEDGKELDENAEISVTLEEEFPDVMVDGMIDLGELAAQYLSLELDPYPRAPGVSLPAQIAKIGTDVKNGPFQVLKGLKPEKKE